MKMELYTMFDVVKQEMGGIMMYKNDAEAMRAAEKMLNSINDDSPVSKNDFKVYKIGQIDTETMEGPELDPTELTINVNME